MQDNLASAISTCQKGADDCAFLFDGGVGKHHEYECHDNDDDVEQGGPHGRIAFNIVCGVANSLVGACIGEVVDICIGIRHCLCHIFFGIGAVCNGKVAVGEGKRVGVCGCAASVFKRFKARGGNFGNAIGDGVHGKVGVIEEKRLAVRLGHDAADGVGAAFKIDGIAHMDIVVFCKHAVDGNFFFGCRF